ncbi:VanZ family protein [Halobacteriales archaeon Cl-PHB]
MCHDRRARWLVAAEVALAVVGGSLVPSPLGRHPAFSVVGPDKLLHLLGYAALSAALADALAGEGWGPPARSGVAVAVSVVAGYGVGVCQRFVPGRESETADFVAGVLGAVLGVVGLATASPDRTGRWRRVAHRRLADIDPSASD